MALGASITLAIDNDGSSSNLVFDNQTRGVNEVKYFAVSPQGDLQGRPSLRVSHEERKGGIVASLLKFDFPVFDAAKDEYAGSVTVNCTLIRPRGAPIQTSKDAMEALADIIRLNSDAVLIAMSTATL